MKKSLYLMLTHVFCANIIFFIFYLIIDDKKTFNQIDTGFYIYLSVLTSLGGLIASLFTKKAVTYTFLSILVSGFLFGFILFFVMEPTFELKKVYSKLILTGYGFLISWPIIICGGILQYLLLRLFISHLKSFK